MTNKTLSFTVRGNVQGVSYRFFAREEARSIGITGFVRNHPDGTVVGVASGRKELLEQFIQTLQRGPVGAQVERVDIQYQPSEIKLGKFEIRG